MSLQGIRAVLAIALVAAAGLVACGEDDDPVAGSTETTSEQTTTEQPTTVPAEIPSEVPDEGHEGGGPDPGTEEAEAAEDLAEPQADADEAGSGGIEAGDAPDDEDGY